MLVLYTLLFGLIAFSTAQENDYLSVLNFSSTSSRNIYLENIAQNFQNHAVPGHSLKIVNGLPATEGQFCWQAYLQFTDGSSRWMCGGSLITENSVLTAAHCAYGATSAKVVLGATDLRKFEPGRRVIDVNDKSHIIVHENYSTTSFYNDLAIVRLPGLVRLNGTICVVNAVNCDTNLTDSGPNNYTISGWGKTSDFTTTSKLMYINVPKEPQDPCASFYKNVAGYTMRPTQFCTSGRGIKGTCNGDSGGAVVQTDESSSITQRGIVSLGLNSCTMGAPSVHTNVTCFRKWICSHLEQ